MRYFKIRYYAKKYGKFIDRKGQWTENCKLWKSKQGQNCFTYYDVNQNEYRTATGEMRISIW